MEKPVLYVVNWSIYPRRILTYLREKGIEDRVEVVNCDFSLSADKKPPGQVPILRIAEDRFITESVAIIEYLEDIHPQEPKLRGTDAYSAATVRSLIAAMDMAIPLYFVYLANTSEIFKPKPQSADAARSCLAYAHKYFGVLERNLPTNGPFLTESQEVTIADVVLATTFEYTYYAYGSAMWETHPRLEQFWNAFKDRPSLDHENWISNLVPKGFLERAQKVDVRWSHLSEDEREISKDVYLNKSKAKKV